MLKQIIREFNLMPFLDSYAQHLEKSYVLSAQKIRESRQPGLFREALGHERHWCGMEDLHSAATATGLSAKFLFPRRKTCRYVLVSAGPLLLTATLRPYPSAPLRLSDFRDKLIHDFNRPWLPGCAPAFPEGEKYYGVLVHGNLVGDGDRLSFLRLRLPAWEKDINLDEIDILAHLADERARAATCRTEEIAKQAMPRLRRHQKVQKE